MGAALALLLALLGLGDALGRRRRLRALARLAAPDVNADVNDDDVAGGVLLIVRPGVALDEATRKAARQHLRRHGLEALDLVSPRLGCWRLDLLARTVDPAHYRSERLATGASAGDVLVIDAALAARLPPGTDLEPRDAPAMLALARLVKRHAATATDIVVAPTLAPSRLPLRERRRLVHTIGGDVAITAFVAKLLLGALALALAPRWGLLAVAVYQLRGLVLTAATGLRPRDRLAYTVGRAAVEALSLIGARVPPPRAEPDLAALRRVYDALLADGIAPFFEAPRPDCPLCGATRLERHIDVGDRYQLKPGRFTLVRCRGCDHVFQNPRLSPAGLAFYYRDFYDGLGEQQMDALFACNPRLYRARARMIAAVAEPRRWLDVGAGHGHFCCVARELFPATRFDGLDLSPSIEDAARQRWIDRAIRGLFPDEAAHLAARGERYDLVSMSHYLEHTLDPRAEIAAAARVLDPGGLLFVEVPDPDCAFGRLLGARWMPWFQPQHLHFVSVANLTRLLREHGFEPLRWQRGEAHQAFDLSMLALCAIQELVPAELPWLPRARIAPAPLRRLVWAAGLPVLVGAMALDNLLAPLWRRPGWSNTYRVIARRVSSS